MITFYSPKPLSDEEIIAESPILWSMGDIRMNTPLLSFKNLRTFNKTATVLAEYFLVNEKERLSEESKSNLEQAQSELPILKIWDDFGLPYFLITISKPENKETAINIYNDFCIDKATRLGNLDTVLENKIMLDIALTDYLMYNSTPQDIFDLYRQIATREQIIKKKLVQILTTQDEIQPQLPLSSHNAKILEFQRRKQQRLSHSSKSS